jgi:hypothetical protein
MLPPSNTMIKKELEKQLDYRRLLEVGNWV